MSVPMATTLTPTTLACPAKLDVESAVQPPTALLALPSLFPMEMEHAPAPTKLTSLFLLMELDIVLLVATNAKTVLIQLLAQLVFPLTLSQEIKAAFVLLSILLIALETVCLALMVVKSVLLPQIARAVSLLFFFKERHAKLPATMDLLLLDLFALVAPLDAKNVLIILFATTVLITTSCTKEIATLFALLEQSEIDLVEAGFASLATLLAKLA